MKNTSPVAVTIISAWAGSSVYLEPGGGYITIGQGDLVRGKDDGVGSIIRGKKDTVVISSRIFDMTSENPKRVEVIGGWGYLGSPNVVVLMNDHNGQGLLHEWGHNANLAHTDPLEDGPTKAYTMNVMAYMNQHWINGEPINVEGSTLKAAQTPGYVGEGNDPP